MATVYFTDKRRRILIKSTDTNWWYINRTMKAWSNENVKGTKCVAYEDCEVITPMQAREIYEELTGGTWSRQLFVGVRYVDDTTFMIDGDKES